MFHSIDLKGFDLANFKEKDIKLIVIGSSCTGKTTVVDLFRKLSEKHIDKIVVPKRYITRPQRENDNLTENEFITKVELLELQDKGEIEFIWERPMEGDRVELYGFEKVNTKPKIKIFSGNNALAYHQDKITPKNIIDDTTIYLGVFAPEKIRTERFIQRSPDLVASSPEEVAYRLGDKAENILPYSQLVIHNYGENELLVEGDLDLLMDKLLL